MTLIGGRNQTDQSTVQKVKINGMRYIRKTEDGHKGNSRPLKERTVKEEESTHNRYQALSNLETIREEDEAEEPMYVFDKSDNGKWIREEAVDSGAVECVTSKKKESRRGEAWTHVGGNEIKREGKVTVSWRTDLGNTKRGVFKSRTSVENTDQCGQTPRNRS